MIGMSMMTARTLVLVVANEPQLQKLLRSILESNGYRVVVATRLNECGFASVSPDLIIIDLDAADSSVLARIKRLLAKTEVIVLSGRYCEADCTAALGIGADYLERPFRTADLLARIHAALLRGWKTKGRHRFYRSASVVVDALEFSAQRNGQPLPLTPSELRILSLLAREAGRVVGYQKILHALNRPDSLCERQTLRKFIWSLRRKIEEDPHHPALLLTESRIGYRLTSAPSEATR
jgi:two-component system KDP operon response regulator KdpE